MNIKLKSRKKVTTTRSTVNDIHETKMREFEEYYATLPDVRAELAGAERALVDYLAKPYVWSATEPDEYDLRQNIKRIRDQVEEMVSQADLAEYMHRVVPVLERSRDKTTAATATATDSVGIKKFITTGASVNRADIMDEYNAAANQIPLPVKNDYRELFTCTECGKDMENKSSEVLLSCTGCGMTKHWQDPDMVQWSDNAMFTKTYRYKKLGYFIEHLHRMQARECTTIPDHVINGVMMKLREKRVVDNTKITKPMVKNILKELDMTGYYDNVNRIILTISGQEAPKFPEDLEEKLTCMFMRTLAPFEKHKSLIPSRNNYLSYPYTIRKLLEILNSQDPSGSAIQFVQYFGLLKSRDKTWEHERVWKKICEDNNWPFIPSI